MTDADIFLIAGKLAGSHVVSVAPVVGGGNNRLYCVSTDTGRYALKSYLRQDTDPRDRLNTEFRAMRFLNQHNDPAIPTAVACDPGAGFALYEWVDGFDISNPGESEIMAALDFVKRLKSLSREKSARELPLASEACLSAQELIKQVQARLTRLRDVSATHRPLKAFLDNDLAPLFSILRDRVLNAYAAGRWLPERDIDEAFRILSPSDFGFHNALRTVDGDILFIDLEYFGWDDPVRLVADFLLHPGMQLRDVLKRKFADEAAVIFCDDGNFKERFDLLYPLIGLRWVLIILNDFLPERQERRRFASQMDPKMSQERNLVKASELLKTIKNNGRHSPYGYS